MKPQVFDYDDSEPLPPVDWDMVRESMASIRAGKTGEPIEELIRRIESATNGAKDAEKAE